MEKELRRLGEELAAVRGRPCVFYASDFIRRVDVLALQLELDKLGGAKAVDMVVHGPGGDPHAAFMVAREFGRRFEEVTAFVPLLAKSGATMVCLVASELVLGSLGELGPIDVQTDETQPGEFHEFRSCLERFKALEHLQKHAVETFDIIVRITLLQGMNVLDSCNVAAEFTGKLMAPVYSQVKPEKIGQSARNLELAEDYARRILKCFRSEIGEDQREQIVTRLSREYPTHAVIVDLEELAEIGLSARCPTPEEKSIVQKMEHLLARAEGLRMIEACLPVVPAEGVDTSSVPESGGGGRVEDRGPVGVLGVVA